MRRKNTLGSLFCLCTLTCLLIQTGWAQVAAPTPPPIRLFQGTSFPAPPRQNEPWAAAGDQLQKMAAALFELGMADPRGCEYREVELAFGSPWNGGGVPQLVHAWLIPGEHQGQRFAISWSGLIYPVWKIGEPVSLAKDVEAIAKPLEAKKDRYSFDAIAMEGSAASQQSFSPLKPLLLSRLGEDAMAQRLWKLSRHNNESVYLDSVSAWTWSLYERAVCAHMRGDDRLALLDTEILVRAMPVIEAECARLKIPVQKDDQDKPRPYLDNVKDAPKLLADSRRRLETPAKTPPEPGSLEAQILDLENVDERQWGQPGGVSVGADHRVQALVKRGDAAIEPLLEVMEKDNRLTRSVSFHRNFFRSRHLIPVAEAAYAAISQITRVNFPSYDEKTNRSYTRAEAVKNIRAYWEKNKGLNLEERWLRTLKDDKATIRAWLEAVENIVQPTDVEKVGGWETIPNRKPGQKVAFRGEILRKHTNPSVSELIIQRSDQAASTQTGSTQDLWNLGYAVDMAMDLAQWEPASARPLLRRRLERMLELTMPGKNRENYRDYNSDFARHINRVVPALSKLGDEKAWDLYAGWLRSIDFKENSFISNEVLKVAVSSQGNRAMATALNWMFNDPQGQWYDVLSGQRTPYMHDMRMSGVTKTRAFWRKTLNSLGDTRTMGKVAVKKSPNSKQTYLRYETRHVSGGFTLPAVTDATSLTYGKFNDFRVCDYYAFMMSIESGAPSFQLYWPQAKRDATLKQYRPWLVRKLGEFPKWNK